MILTLIWIFSFIAAAGFLLSGYLFGRSRAAVGSKEGTEAHLREELDRITGILNRESTARREERDRAAEALAAYRESREEIERLRTELMRREGTLADETPTPSSSPRSALSLSEDAGGLDEAIKAIARRPGHQNVVIADELGFPIVGFGDGQEPLAALCGIINELDSRASQLLTVGPARRVTLETDRGTTVSACSGTFEGVSLTLATTTEGPGLETNKLRAALDDFLKTLAAGGYRRDQETTT